MTNQPITLTPDEYQALLNDLAMRDPVMRMLIQKQEQAQREADAGKPMRVVGGAA